MNHTDPSESDPRHPTAGRTGWTTGTCAAAAAKAAALRLFAHQTPTRVTLRLPEGGQAEIPLVTVEPAPPGVRAAVRKDAGDDPDITHGALVESLVEPWPEGDVVFAAGEGVGVVTKPGLQVPPGEPAINPIPRRMIRDAIREVTARPVRVTVSVQGGRALAQQTFNPRLGIEGGLSILGTTGIVRPRCTKALRDALRCALHVARACGVTRPVLVPGNIGLKAARRHFRLAPEQAIEVSNEWGWVLDQFPAYDFAALLAVGHPGKLVKLAHGDWNTHSAQSASAVETVRQTIEGLATDHSWGGRSCSHGALSPCPASSRSPANAPSHERPPTDTPSSAPTVEGLLMALEPDRRRRVGDRLAEHVRAAIENKLGRRLPVAVCLINMRGEWIGASGALAPYQ